MSFPLSKLGNHIDILSGFAFKTKDFVESGIPIIKIKNITPPSVSLSDLSFVSKDIARKTEKFLLNKGDVLIALTGSHINQMASVVGRVARVNYSLPSLLNQRVGKVIIKDSDNTDLDYIYYFLSQDSIKIKLASKAGGAANQANISPTDVKNLDIPLPDIAKQRKISGIIKAYDDLIENNQKQIKLLKEMAQRLYKEWFVDFRFPGYENTPIIDGVPDGWEKDTIDSRISLLSGFAFASSQFDGNGKYKIVTIKNVKDGEFDGDNTSRIVSVPDKMPKHCILEDGDILLSLTGNVGRTCMVYGNNYLLNQRVAKLHSNFHAFTYCLFRSNDMFDAMNNLANGAAQQNLSPVRTGKLLVLFPSDKLLKEFERVAGTLIDKMLILQKQCVIAKKTRDFLLPKLMNGEMEI